jgi:hypothetical protein
MSEPNNQPKRYQCERCGGTGQIELAGNYWSVAGNAYTPREVGEKCDSCDGQGLWVMTVTSHLGDDQS